MTQPTYSETGTHVLTTAPDGVTPYWCPVEALDIYTGEKGFTVAGADTPTPEDGNEPPVRDFDPSLYSVDAVNAHLAAAHAVGDQAEVDRVLAAEAAGKNRTTVKHPAAPTAGDPA